MNDQAHKDLRPPDAQKRARLLDIALSCIILGFLGVIFTPCDHGPGVFARRMLIVSEITAVIGLSLFTLWVVVASLALQKRREINRPGFPVLPPNTIDSP